MINYTRHISGNEKDKLVNYTLLHVRNQLKGETELDTH